MHSTVLSVSRKSPSMQMGKLEALSSGVHVIKRHIIRSGNDKKFIS